MVSSKAVVIDIVIFFVFILAIGPIYQPIKLRPVPIKEQITYIPHKIDQVKNLKMVWELQNISLPEFMIENPAMIAKNEKIFIMKNDGTKVTVLNSSDGSVLGEVDATYPITTFTTDGSFIFIGTSGDCSKYSFDEKKWLWLKALDPRHVFQAQLVDNELQLSGFDFFYRISPEDGTLVSKSDLDYDGMRFENGIYYEWGSNFIMAKDEKGSILWESQNFHGDILQTPVFLRNTIYVRASDYLYAIDRQTGKTIWRSDRVVVGSIAADGNRVYYLTMNGTLIGRSSKTLKIMTSVQFSQQDFYHPDEHYMVAYGADSNKVFVALGDSKQLFAFKDLR